jgi:hypothetical protein
VQKDVLGGWHKDDGTEEASPANTGYFSRHTYDLDDCKVYKMGVYLQDHDHDKTGLWVREGSHRLASFRAGEVQYTNMRAGDVIVFDVRITHSGQFKSLLERKLLVLSKHVPQRFFDWSFATARTAYRALRSRERIALFFTFGLPNQHTIEFARSNMRRQLRLTPGTSPRLPSAIRKAFESRGVVLAEDHFTGF